MEWAVRAEGPERWRAFLHLYGRPAAALPAAACLCCHPPFCLCMACPPLPAYPFRVRMECNKHPCQDGV